MRPRAQGISRWARFLTVLNFVFAAIGALFLMIAVQSEGERAPVGFILGVPLCLGQVLIGLLPAVLCVRREKLLGKPRHLLLAAAIAGPVMSAVAAVVSLLTFGGC